MEKLVILDCFVISEVSGGVGEVGGGVGSESFGTHTNYATAVSLDFQMQLNTLRVFFSSFPIDKNLTD